RGAGSTSPTPPVGRPIPKPQPRGRRARIQCPACQEDETLTERKLGVGVIGCGNIANGAHLPNYARNPRVKIVAVADVDVERARTTAERWGAETYYQDYRELLARPDIEAVSVTTWVSAHAD